MRLSLPIMLPQLLVLLTAAVTMDERQDEQDSAL